jgi:hypothetical protein
MHIYLDRIELDTFRHWKLKDGSRFFLRLAGVNIVPGELPHVEPVYLPVLAIDRRGSLTYLELAWNRPLLLVVLVPSWPFVHIERLDRIALGDE